MGRRDRLISTSILRAIFQTKSAADDEDVHLGLLARILAFFAIFSLTLARYRAKLFRKLRNETWQIEEEEYTESFRSPSKNKRTDLVAIGDLGYSGSVCIMSQIGLHRNLQGTDVLYHAKLKISHQIASSCL